MSNSIKISKKTLCEKLLRLRSRIEDWASLNGYQNIENQTERKNKDGEVVWKRSDWEHVDSMYGCVINGDEITWGVETYRELNKMWKKYKIDVWIENPNLKPEWEQLQQMEWDEDIWLSGPDPTMGVGING